MIVHDRLTRPLQSLRLSVTDHCNLRCHYCMPDEGYRWLPRADLLSFEELATVADVFTDAGVRELHVTGGEPLLRRQLATLIRLLCSRPLLEDVALTTNGVLLGDHAESLHAAGLRRVTVSLDTLVPERFRALARRDELARVLAGLQAARGVGLALGLNSVIVRGRNDDEVPALLELGGELGAEVRFIEYMDVGGATRWRREDVVSRDEILRAVVARFGAVRPLLRTDSAPAEHFLLPDGRRFGIIAPVTAPFCRHCDRARLTADGQLFMCLYATSGVDLRTPLRAGATRTDLAALVSRAWTGRGDHGAELRASLGTRGPLLGRDELAGDPHLEMHARGG